MKDEILDKHLGLNAEMGYKPIDRSDVIAAMEEYARVGMLEELELHIRLNEDDWCRNPQAQLERFTESMKANYPIK